MKINEHVLITGSSSKLGTLISKILAKKKFSLLLHYYKSEEKTINLAKILKEKFKNQNFYPLYLDLSKNHSLEFMSEIIFPETKNIHGIINNASLYTHDNFNDFDKDNFNSNLNIHFRNPLNLISIISDNLSNENKKGFAINITDKNLNRDNRFSYNFSKTLLSNWSNKNYEKTLKIIEFKPGDLLPSGDSEKTKTDFKHIFSKLIEYNYGHPRR
jgi:short-subunit dehydrogenase